MEWLSSPIDVSAGSDATLARVYFFDKLPADIRERRLQEIALFQFQMLQKLQALEKRFAAMENTDSFYFMLSTLYYGIQLLHDNIRWCEHIRAQKPLPDFIREGDE